MCCHFHILRFICLSSMWVNMTFGTMLSYCRIPPDAVRGSSCHNDRSVSCIRCDIVGTRRSLKNSGSHIDASHSRQPLVKGERLVRYEVNAVIVRVDTIFESVNLYIFIMVFDAIINTHAYLYHFEYFDAGQFSWDV